MIALGFWLALSTPQKLVEPVVPAGSNRSFQEAVIAVEESLSKSDFEGAKLKLKALPRTPVLIELDDSKVPTAMKLTMTEAVRKAMLMWEQNTAIKSTLVAKGGHLKFSFDKELPKTELGLPLGAGHLFSTDPAEARLQVALGLNRGNPISPAMPSEIQNEVAHAIGLYLGLDRSLRPGSTRFRTDLSGSGLIPVGGQELYLSRRLSQVVETLNKAVATKTPLTPARPKIFLEVSQLKLPAVVQGGEQSFRIQVTNNGNAPLSLFVEPDCGCLAPFAPPEILPGVSAQIVVRVNTIDYVGKIRKWLFVHSNDPEFPSRDIPVDLTINPVFRIVRPGPSILQMGEEDVTAEAYLWFGDGAKISPTAARVDGIRSEVEMEPWEGMMADPELGEAAVLRKGYRLKMRFQSTYIPGRSTASIVVTTDHPIFKTLRASLGFQRGIVALPERLYLGEIEKSANRSMFLVSRPGQDFKITKIETNSPFLKAVSYPVQGAWEYRINVELTGEQDSGQFEGVVTIYTDDPKQPKLEIKVEATIR